MDGSLAKDLDHEVRATVEHLRVLNEIGRRVDETLKSDDTNDVLETTDFEPRRSVANPVSAGRAVHGLPYP